MKPPNVLSGLLYSGSSFERPQLQISVRKPVVVTDDFRDLSQTFYKNATIGYQIRLRHFSSISLQITVHWLLFFLVCYSWCFQLLRLCSVGDRWRVSVKHWWSDADNGALELRENPVLSDTFPTTNSAWTSLDLNPSLRSERPAVDHLSHGTATNYHYGGHYIMCKQRH